MVIDFIAFLGHIILLPFEFLLSKIKSFKPNFKSKKKSRNRKKIKIKIPSLPKLPKLKLRVKLPRLKFPRIPSVILHVAFGFVFALAYVIIPLEVYGWYRQLPSPELLAQVTNKSTKILDRNGKLLYEIYVDRNYDPVGLEQIPDHVIKATLAMEDDKFYSHHGVRLWSMARAATATVLGGKLQGGSTITQQLVKNILLSPERTFSRKIKEVVLALMVEAKYSKDEILEMYLNNIPYGGTSWGVQAASQRFFGKDVWNLSLTEASFLAGLPTAPSSYSPFIGGIEIAKDRQRTVLERMAALNYITQEEMDNALAQAMVFAPQEEYIRAPHFVNFVREELGKEYGANMVNSGGLTVKTTLDLDLQEKAQEAVRTGVEASANLQISNGAAVVLDAKSGEVLAYVGSKDYFSNEIDGKYDVVTAYRQPGSSIKPVTYALAFQKGFTPATVIEDEPITYNSPGTKPYTPVNYDGKTHGKVTVRQALANSYNIPAVKVAAKIGADAIVEFGKSLGLTRWEPRDGSYGISVTLGGKEVRLLDLANVYATFARNGETKSVSPLLSVKDAKGFEIYTRKENGKRAMPDGVAYLITNILADNNARSAAFGSSSWLNVPGYQVAVKTGTTDLKRDNWTFGYTPSYVVGVWVGNNDNTPMNPYLSSGLSGAAPIWNQIFSAALSGKEPEYFSAPKSVFVKTDQDCDNKSEIFVRGTAPEHLCDPKDDDKDGD